MEKTWEIPRPAQAQGSAASAVRAAGKEHVRASTVAYVLRLREELEAERARVRERSERVARLEGALETSDRVEASAQRYADRLEAKLEASRKREATLAREVGRLELRAERAELLLAQPEPDRGLERRGWLAKLTRR